MNKPLDKTLYWYGSDSQENFLNNKKNNNNLLKSLGWLDQEVTYEINSLGFRSDDFTSEPSVMFLGCSFTVGIGVNLENTWTNLVSTGLNLKSSNLGVGGGSCDTAFRLCFDYIDIIKPKLVIIMPPSPYRYEIFLQDNKDPTLLGPWAKRSDHYRTWSAIEHNVKYQKLKNILAIEKLCIDRSINFYNTDNNTNINKISSDKHGRDLCHPGINWHAMIANEILNDLT